MKQSHPVPRSGFTLIEGIIATGIISAALIVGLTLAYSNLVAAQANSDRIIATNLAREGLEVLRNIRDSNWLRRDANIDKDADAAGIQFYQWDDFFDGWPARHACSDGASCYRNFFDVMLDLNVLTESNAYKYTLREVTGSTAVEQELFTCIAGNDTPCRIQERDGFYFQAGSPDITASFTNFYRRINLRPVCWNGSTENVEDKSNMVCDAGFTKVGVLVTSEVVWKRGTKISKVEAKERLYNWRTN